MRLVTLQETSSLACSSWHGISTAGSDGFLVSGDPWDVDC